MTHGNRLVSTVVEDLQHLAGRSGANISEADIRRDSGILRRLLINGDLQLAWNSLGIRGRVEILAPSLEPTLARIPTSRILFACAGGAKLPGTTVQSTFIVKGEMSPSEIAADFELCKNEPRLHAIRLKHFLKAPGLVIDGKLVARSAIIKYAANFLGGVHVDSSGAVDEAEHRLLEGCSGIALVGFNALYFELLSIGYFLGNSPSSKRLAFVAGGGDPHDNTSFLAGRSSTPMSARRRN